MNFKLDKYPFLLFSCVSGFLEIGCIIFAIQHSFPIYQILLLAIAYQLGSFFTKNIRISFKIIVLLNIIAIGCYYFQSEVSINFFLLWVGILSFSVCLQAVRGPNKALINTGEKRIFRIIGFALAPLFSLQIMTILSMLVFIVAFFSRRLFLSRLELDKIIFQDYIMIFHQMHYFSYSYFVLIIAITKTGFSSFSTSLLFALGWITYAITPYFANKRHYIVYFFSGHIFLLLVLVLMGITNNYHYKILLWIITGFGGGTVFCIEKILELKSRLREKASELSENIGHVLGVIVGFCCYAMFKDYDAVIFLSAFLVGITILIMLIYLKLNGIKEISL